MAKKEFVYRGKSLEELKSLSIKEFASLLPSRRRRSLERGFTEAQKSFLVDLRSNKEEIKTHCRSIVILPEMVGRMIKVYNGKSFNIINIEAEMIGHVLGEFSLTRNKVSHSAPGVGATRSSASVSVR